MKKALLMVSSLALLALAGCNQESNVIPDPSASGELAVLPMNGGSASRMTKGYVEEKQFVETYYSTLHSAKTLVPRTMQLSAYLTPQNGEAKNYFVDKTYSKDPSSETTWWNTNIVGGDHDPIYWPVGGTLDFLAYSVSSEESGAGKSQNIKAVWDNTNAAQKVTLTVPGENTQNDILFASAYGEKSRNTGSPVNMTFNHSQAWLEFILTGSVTDASAPEGANKPIVNVKRIELEDVYNAGTLNITNNGGNAIAKWDFTGEDKQNIAVDNFNANLKLTGSPKYLDMLIPQQTKTAFVIYYSLGSSSKELSYRFTTDQKTWLMGEKYIYKINITTSEVTVAPIVTIWNGPVQGFEYTVKTPATTVMVGENTLGTVKVDLMPSADSFKGTPAEDGSATYTCDTWGAQVTLEAEPEDGCVFLWWSDGVTENTRTFTITESVELPEAVFSYKITADFNIGYVYGNASTVEYLDCNKAKLTAGSAPAETSFAGWIKEGGNGTILSTETTYETVPADITAATNFIPVFKSNAASKYVDIITELNDDNTVKTHTKWAKQNLSISSSGEKAWKGGNASAVKVPGTDENVKNGDYFQWAAYEKYALPVTDFGEGKTDKGLLLYTEFTSTGCGEGSDTFTLKSGKTFYPSSVPYSPAYTKYQGTGDGKDGKTVLEKTPVNDDVASIILGSSWRMPELAEFKALTDATVWAWDATDKGYYVFAPVASNTAGKIVGNTEGLTKAEALLFFPAAGGGNNRSLEKLGAHGRYWSSSLRLSDTDKAYNLGFSSSDVDPEYWGSRIYGWSVRPVSD